MPAGYFARTRVLGWLCLLAGNLALIGLNFWRYPLGSGRDELDHWRLINFYDGYHRLPILPQDLDAASVQAHQPPLYYLLASLLVSPVDVESCYDLNPFLLTGNYLPELPRYNRVLFVETEPACRTMGLRLRWFSVLLNLLAVAILYSAYRSFFSTSGYTKTLLSLAFLTLTPTFWRTAITISNNQLLFFWVACFWWLLVRADSKPAPMGIVLGLGLLTKIYMLPLIVIALSKNRRLPMIFLAGLWYLRNFYLYHDVSAATLTEKILHSQRPDSYSLFEYGKALLTLWGELWLESWMIINTRPSLMLASVIGWLLLISHLAAWRRNPPALNYLTWGTLIPVLIMALYAEGRNLHAEYSSPLLLPALPALAAMFANGILAWTPPRHQNRMTLTAIWLILLGTLLFHISSFLNLFPLPATHQIEHELNIPFENGIRLQGFSLPQHQFKNGDLARLKLCWEATQAIHENYAFTVKFLHPELPNAAHLDGYPLSGRVLTSQWEVGKPYCEWLSLPVNGKAHEYLVFVGMFHLETGQVFYTNGRRDNYLILASVWVE